MREWMQKLPASWPYVASIALTKGFSLLTIPLLANVMAQEDYGRLDVVVSFMEFLGLVFAMGLADTLFRFASIEENGPARRQVAAEIIGTGVLLALLLGVVVQLAVPLFLRVMPLEFGEGAIRAGFLAATVSGLIALPLAWLRLQGRPFNFLLFTAARGLFLAVSTIVVALCGLGVEAILYSNAAVDALIALAILVSMVRETGISFRLAAFRRTVTYGLPLVGGSLAMFALGACDRWFLVASVPAAALAYYAVATKLALAAPLLMQPFSLWWLAQRIVILEREDGLAESARHVGAGFAILITSAVAITLAGPLFIHWTMPADYLRATDYLPFLVAVMVLNETNTLVNVGVYRRSHSFLVLMINATAALVALAGYALLIPAHGIGAAIGVTLFAQTIRFGLFVFFGRKAAPISYPFRNAAILAGFAVLIVYAAPTPPHDGALLLFIMIALPCLLGAAHMLGLIALPIAEGKRVLPRLAARVQP